MPVKNRRVIPAWALCANHPNAAFTIATQIAVRVKRCRGLRISGRLKSALNSVPATNPICTDSVNQPAAVSLRRHSLVNAGTTADPLNHSDMPSSSAIASNASVRQRDPKTLFVEDIRAPCKAHDCNAKARLRADYLWSEAQASQALLEISGKDALFDSGRCSGGPLNISA